MIVLGRTDQALHWCLAPVVFKARSRYGYSLLMTTMAHYLIPHTLDETRLSPRYQGCAVQHNLRRLLLVPSMDRGMNLKMWAVDLGEVGVFDVKEHTSHPSNISIVYHQRTSMFIWECSNSENENKIDHIAR